MVFLGVCPHTYGAGFGLYEASSSTYALGGAVVGRALDASANFYNPATLTDLTNITMTVGLMTEHPRAKIKVNGHGDAKMNPGVYVLPHFHMAVPLGGDFAFGLGIMPEYGLGSRYNSSWPLAFNSQRTEVTSFTVNPNLAYRITDNWSIGAGLRFLFFDFEQDSEPVQHLISTRLKGDNAMKDFGWQLGTKYDLLGNLSLGLVYKSRTLVHVDGKTEMDSPVGYESGDAWTELTLPQSIAGGFNWDITDDWHLGGVVAWTEWSSVDTLQFHLPGLFPSYQAQTKPIQLEWSDTWRFGLAPSWDFVDHWTAICSYVYEMDCSGSQDSTMLPPSRRHMISLGLMWHWCDSLDVTLAYGAIIMNGGESFCTDTASGQRYRYHAEHGISHATGLTVTYRF